MADSIEQFDLSDEQAEAVKRFRELHRDENDYQEDSESKYPRHQLHWLIDEEANRLSMRCSCGATLYVSEPIYVSVKPNEFKLVDGECLSVHPKPAEKPTEEVSPASKKEGSKEYVYWVLNCRRDAAIDSLYQSALVTLPHGTFEQIRLHPSRSDMHFSLGLYLRNRFVHSGLLGCAMHPDDQSGATLDKLIRYCVPEFADFDFIYDRISSGVLYDAYRYCMEVRNELPEEELKRHYDILLEAQTIYDSNPYSILDDMHRAENDTWWDRYFEKIKEYDIATLREIWSFEKVCAKYGEKTTAICENICLSAANGDGMAFIPSEIAGVLAGACDESSIKALDWSLHNYRTRECLPDSLRKKCDLIPKSSNGEEPEESSTHYEWK